MNPDSIRIWHKVLAILEVTSCLFVIGSLFAILGIWRLVHRRSISKWNAVTLGICAAVVACGVLIGCYEVQLCADGRHAEESMWHKLLALSVLLEAVAAFALLGDADGRRWAAVSSAFGFVVVQFSVFITFEITFNGFG